MGFSGSMPMRCAWLPGENGDGAVLVAAAAPHVGTARKYLAASSYSSSARTSGRSSEARVYEVSARDSLRGSLEGNPWS